MGELEISSDPARIDRDLVCEFLSRRAYWALGRSRERIERSLAHSLVFGAYRDGRQLGFARVVTDRATFAYLCDVFVIESARGQGIGKRLMGAVCAHPDLQGLRRFHLVTRDAHALYAQFGFTPLATPELHMERTELGAAAPGAAAPSDW
ncbi:MAG: GNAT family N-acetyltransferase [Planctomycetes bacterium]|nr:GNAT family N-acetyltransferase [Planctomycetota bacterium]